LKIEDCIFVDVALLCHFFDVKCRKTFKLPITHNK